MASNSDPNSPTNESNLPPSARKLPDGMVELPRFFILDEHEFVDEKSGEKVKLTKERLEELARRINTRRKRTGDLVPICPGHTVDGIPETRQPEIVGYAVDAQVEPFFDTGKYAISVTPIALSESHVEYFKKMPRRSVELWLSPDDIDPIALLGSTTPRRDLGLHRFSRGGNSKSYHYELSEPQIMADPNSVMPPATPMPSGDGPQVDPALVDAVTKAVLEALPQTPLMQALADALNSGALSDQSQGEEMPEDDDMLDSPEDEEGMEEEGMEDMPEDEDFDDESRPEDGPDEKTEELDEEDEEEPIRNSMSHPSGTNTSMPGYGKKKMSRSYIDHLLAEKAEQLKASQERKALVKLQRENAELNKRLEILEQERKVNEATELLRELDEIGMTYNAEREMRVLVKMSKKAQREYIDNYKSIFTNSGVKPLPNGGKVPVKPEEQSQVKMQKAGEIVTTDTESKVKSFDDVSRLAEEKLKRQNNFVENMGGKVVPVR